jgi:glycosyltransferase involved in cell wall biosynthesis
MDKLVSILTPCYNGELFIDRYAESILMQNYNNCQLIFIDDGSTDKTRDKIMSYESRFRNNGILLEYHYNENLGLGGAIAKGVQHIRGEYIIWSDVDDILPEDSIRSKYNYLESHPEYGLVRTNFIVARDEPTNIINNGGADKYKHRSKSSLFSDYLVSKNMWLICGCYMIRTSTFLRANPDRFIFPSRTGQNWQMLLPVLYNSKCGYMENRTYIYIQRTDSLSYQMRKSFDEACKHLINMQEIIIETIKHMDILDEEKYIKKVKTFYTQQQLSLGYRYKNYNWVLYNWKALSIRDKNIKLWVKKCLTKIGIVLK